MNCAFKQYLHGGAGIETHVCLILSTILHCGLFIMFLMGNTAGINELLNFITY